MDAQELASIIRDHVAREIKSLTLDVEILRAITKRIETLEAAPFEYTGVHVAGKAYHRGQFATAAGSVWYAKCETAQRPGDGGDWTLAVKAGKDAR